MKHTSKLKRLFSAILTVALLLSVTAFAPIPAAAATEEPCTGDHTGWIALSSAADFDDTTKFRGNKNTDGSWKNNDRWPVENGKYYLANDITLSATEVRRLYGYNNSSNHLGSFTICMNGHTLTLTDASTLENGFILMSGTSGWIRTCNICDCSADHTGKMISNPNSAAAPTSNVRPLIYIQQYGTVNFYSGSICDSWAGTSGYGGIVHVQGTQGIFNMYDGATISNIKATGTGMARDVVIRTTGVFNMYGGTITGTDTAGVASVRLTSEATGSVNIYGGSISKAGGNAVANQSTAGGTFNVYGGAFVGGAKGTLNYAVSVNGAQLTSTDSATPGTVAGTGYSYDVATATLTVSDPAEVQSFVWDDAIDFTVKLGANCTTGMFSEFPEGKKLTIDLNGHTLTPTATVLNSGTLVFTDTSGTPGSFAGSITNIGNGTVIDPDHLVSGSVSALTSVTVNGTQLTADATGDGYTYVSATTTLTVTDPTKITSLTWDTGVDLTLVLGADWDTSTGYDPLADIGAKSLILDLAGHVMGKPGYSAVDGESAPAPVQNDLTLSGGASLTIKDSTATTVDGIPGISDGALTGYSITMSGTGTALVLNSGTITDGYKGGTATTDGGGAVRVEGGTFTMNGGRITACYAHNGGAINMRSGTFTMNNGRIDHNTSGRFGTICAGAGTTNLNGGLIDHNTATSSDGNARGGGVACVGGTVKFGAVTFDSNKARVTGGAVYLFSPKTYTMNGTIFTNNECTAGPGGAIYAFDTQSPVLNATNVTFENNKASGSSKSGGAVYLGSTSSTASSFTGCVFTGNTATGNGGAIYAGNSVKLTNCTISGNTATSNGGGIYSAYGKTVTMTGISITANSAVYGGGAYVRGTLDMNSGSISGNTASTAAAELYLGPIGTTFIMRDGTIGVDGQFGTLYSYAVSSSSSGSETSPAAPTTMTIYGGTIHSGINLQGALGADLTVYGGRFHSISLFNLTGPLNAKLYGGSFTNPSNLPSLLASDTLEVGRSADATFPYMIAPKASFDFALNAAETAVDVTIPSENSAWSYYNGSETPSVVTPVTATAKFGTRVVSGLTLANAGGKYSFSVPVTSADYDKQFQVTLFDAESAPVRVFSGYFAGKVVSVANGDMNDDWRVDVKDLVLLMRHLAGGYGVTLETAVADLDGNGSIQTADAVLLARYIVGGYGVTFPSAASTKPFKVLMVGQSLAQDTVWLLHDVLQAEMPDRQFVVGDLYESTTLNQHRKNIETDNPVYDFYRNSNGTIEHFADVTVGSVLEQESWDVVIFNEATFPTTDAAEFTDGDHAFMIDYLRTMAPEAKLAYNATSAMPTSKILRESPRHVAPASYFTQYQDGFGGSRNLYYQAICNNIKTFIETNDAFDYVFHGGTAIQYASETYGVPEADRDHVWDLYRDYVHQSDFGRLIVAYQLYAQLFGLDELQDVSVNVIPAAHRATSIQQGLGDLTITTQHKAALIASVNYALSNPNEIPPQTAREPAVLEMD